MSQGRPLSRKATGSSWEKFQDHQGGASKRLAGWMEALIGGRLRQHAARGRAPQGNLGSSEQEKAAPAAPQSWAICFLPKVPGALGAAAPAPELRTSESVSG